MNERNDITGGDDELVARAKALFDQSVDDLDAATLSQLNRRRHEAMEKLHSGRGLRTPGVWVPAAGIAAAAVLALTLWNRAPEIDGLTTPATATDFEILLNEDSIEMLEHLEFYSWLDSGSGLDGPETGGNVG